MLTLEADAMLDKQMLEADNWKSLHVHMDLLFEIKNWNLHVSDRIEMKLRSA